MVAVRSLTRTLRRLTAAATLVLSGPLGCASSPASRQTAPPVIADVQWSAWTARARELLQRLVAVNTSQPGGAGRAAADILQSFLRREAVETELISVGSDRWAVWGRVEAVDAQGPPVVLLCHLDTESVDRAAWPADAPPFALTPKDGALWGAGIAGGKGLAVLHATSLAVLASVDGPRQRDVHVVALPDALDISARSLDDVISAVPAIATATVALTGGGADVVDWSGNGETVMAVAVGERGTAVLQVATVTRRDGIGSNSSDRLAQALVAIKAMKRPPHFTPTNRAFLREASKGMALPTRWLARSILGAQLLVVPELIDRPGVAAQFIDEIQTLRIEAGRYGDTQSPYRSRAFLTVGLLEDSTPAGMARRLRATVGDPDVHINVRVASAASITGPRTDWLERLRAAAQVTDDTVVVPILGRRPQGADPLRSVGVPVFGVAPFKRTPRDLEASGPVPVSEASFRTAIERMATMVAILSSQ